MSKNKGADNFKNKNSSGLKNQDSALSSKSNPRKSEVEIEDEMSFSEKWKTSRFWLVKGTYYVLHTVWMTVMVIGGFILWLISFLFI